MEKMQLEELYKAIKGDDLKSFTFLMSSNNDLNLCFGRFPILSLCYLYSSYSILSKYEKILMPIHNYKIVEEKFDAYKKFKMYAKKTLRFFIGDEDIVYPIEMLAVLDERIKLSKNYRLLYKNEKIIDNIQKIYNLNTEIDISISQNGFSAPRSKISFGKKLLIGFMISLMVVFSIFSLISVLIVKSGSGLGTINSPIKISSAQELQTALLNGSRCYVLTDDIALTEDFVASDFSGNLDGDGHTIVADEYLINGLISNLTGNVSNLKLSINLTKKITKNYAIFAEKSSGNIKNCEIFGNISINVQALEDVYIAAFVCENSGTVDECKVDLNVSGTNLNGYNAYFGFISCDNTGLVSNCKSYGLVQTDTIDITGIVCVNAGSVSGCFNYSNLSQTTSSTQWNPNVAGIVIENYGQIYNCKNLGDLVSESTTELNVELYVIAGGICCVNYATISACESDGEINATANGAIFVYVGGIVAQNSSTKTHQAKISNSKSESQINVSSNSDNSSVYVGGVVAGNYSYLTTDDFGWINSVNYAEINSSGFNGKINYSSNRTFIGGISATESYSKITGCYSNIETQRTNESSENEFVLCGAIIGEIFQYSRQFENNHYVKTSDNLVACYARENVMNMFYSYSAAPDNYVGATSYENFDDIPEEIRGL